jgi:cell division initiation protein
MKITPIDIQRQEFKQKFKGYDCDEVRTFLQVVSEEYEKLVKEHMGLEDELKHLREAVQEHKEREKILKNTLLTAQKVSEDMKEAAQKEADLILKEAEIKADRMLSQAQIRANKIESTISEMKVQKTHLRSKILSAVRMVQETIDLQDREDGKDDRLDFLKKENSTVDEKPFKK